MQPEYTTTMTYLFLAILFVLLMVSVGLFWKYSRAMRDNRQLRAVVNHQRDYTFLVNPDFEVEETNYFVQTGEQAGQDPQILGNVLHCKNSYETGRCGEGAACRHCPVRFVIRKSFERRGGFDEVEACLEVYGDDKQLQEIDVNMEGRYVNIDDQPHMVVNVQIRPWRQVGLLPKVLFASTDASLYERVQEALSANYRVLSVDGGQQVMHRLLMASDYQFRALFTDDAFFQENATTLEMLTKNEKMPVLVFAHGDTSANLPSYVHCIEKKLEGEELRMKLLSIVK